MPAQVINFELAKANMRERQREERIREIYRLMFEEEDAFGELYTYCLNCRNRPSERSKTTLIQWGLLNPDGSLSDLTNEAMYEIRYGERPFWLPECDQLARTN